MKEKTLLERVKRDLKEFLPEAISNFDRIEKKWENYLQILHKWNQKFNLVGKDTPDFWTQCWADSIVLARLIQQFKAKEVADVGSGAGIPGILLALLIPQKIFLIERSQKKSAFLKAIVRELKLEKVGLINKDVEMIPRKFDVVVGKAVAPPQEFFNLCKNIVKEKGCILYVSSQKNKNCTVFNLHNLRKTVILYKQCSTWNI